MQVLIQHHFLAFCASPKFKVIWLQNHPHVVNPPLSYGIIKFDVALQINNFEEFEIFLNKYVEGNVTMDIKKIDKFVTSMLYKFVGSSCNELST